MLTRLLLIILTVFVTSFINEDGCAARHKEPCTGQEVTVNQSCTDESGQSHENEDCECLGHRSGCGHTSLYLTLQNSSTLLDTPVVQVYSAARSRMKAEPFLDGPFQPPRT